jgi:hypothetical protein
MARIAAAFTASAFLFCFRINAEVRDLRIQVSVYNEASVQVHNVEIAERQASYLLATASVEVEWVNCDEISCAGESRSGRIILRIMQERDTPGGEALGSAGFSGTRGLCAKAFYGNIQRKAEEERVNAGTLLGVAIVHEIGHLLLGKTHSEEGIMRANWTSRDLRRAAQGQLRFTADQVARIGSGVRARSGGPVTVTPIAANR